MRALSSEVETWQNEDDRPATEKGAGGAMGGGSVRGMTLDLMKVMK